MNPEDVVGKFFWHRWALCYVFGVEDGRLLTYSAEVGIASVFKMAYSYQWVATSRFFTLEELVEEDGDDPLVIKLLEELS